MDGKCIMKNDILLADIGNTHFHIYDGKKVEHLTHDEAIVKYKDDTVYYICVKEQLTHKISDIKAWEDISYLMQIKGQYKTMGVDRKALCLSHKEGVFVDAGSAITVDIMKEEAYKGGFILPGLKGYIKTYENISPALHTHLDKGVNLAHLPTTTKEQISYGIIASIKALIDKHSDKKQLYFTGGDGEFLATFFDDAHYDDTLVFQGMMKVI